MSLDYTRYDLENGVIFDARFMVGADESQNSNYYKDKKLNGETYTNADSDRIKAYG